MTSPSDGVLSIEEVAASFSDDLPAWQAEANLNWLKGLHSMMNEGAVWGSPHLGTIYHKRGDGFVLDMDMKDG